METSYLNLTPDGAVFWAAFAVYWAALGKWCYQWPRVTYMSLVALSCVLAVAGVGAVLVDPPFGVIYLPLAAFIVLKTSCGGASRHPVCSPSAPFCQRL